jgi:hypothetical protein
VNEVEIIITGKNTAGPAFKEAQRDADRLGRNLNSTERDAAKLGRELKTVDRDSHEAGRAMDTAPGTGTLTLNNRDGRFSRTNAAGPYYGQLTRNTPIWVTVDAGLGAYDLIRMYVNEWPARWDPTGTDFTVPVQCSGVLRRLGQGGTLQSLLDRYLPNFAKRSRFRLRRSGRLLADGRRHQGHTTRVQDIGSHRPCLWPARSTWHRNPPCPDPTRCRYPPVRVNAVFGLVLQRSAAAITLKRVVGPSPGCDEDSPANPSERNHPHAPGGHAAARLSNGQVVITTTGRLGDPWLQLVHLTEAVRRHRIRHGPRTITCGDVVLCCPSSTDWFAPPDFVFSVAWDAVNAAGVVNPASWSVAVTSGLAREPYALEHLGSGASIGHVTVYPSLSAFADAAAFGFPGETAGDRIIRVCGEEGVLVTVTDAAGTTTMGPQIRGTLLQVLRDCEAADLGVLTESGWNLAYQSRAERYNAPVAMTINYTSGALATIEPTDDDQRLRNKWTVTRTNGSSATATDQECVDLHGLYADAATVNVQSDTQVQGIANWLVHRGITDDLRWPNIGLHLDNIAGRQMIANWMGVQVGSRVQITNLPTQVIADTVDVFVEGITQTVTPLTWTATMMTTPASPFNIFTLADASLGRLDSDTSTLATSTTLQNVTSMSWSLTASAVYLFDLVFMFNAGITPDIKIGWTVPTSTTMNWGGIFPDTAGTYSAVAGLTESSTQAIGGAGAARQGRFAGLITVSTTAGTLQLQSAQNTSDAATISVLTGTHGILTRVRAVHHDH